MNRGNLPGYTKAMPPLSAMPALLQPKIMFFGTISPGHASVVFIRAICEIRGSSSLRSKWPLAVTQAAWSAAGLPAVASAEAGGRGYARPIRSVSIRVDPWLTPRGAIRRRC